MRDLETLTASVRDEATRKQVAEVVRAYQAGAFRAAIISTWVAVALDLVSKLRELAADGDAAAAVEVANLDAAITGGNLGTLQKFENNLLTLAKDTFELISQRDFDVLNRLQVDRNKCAHPAFVAPDDVFDPTSELARSHIAAAVDAVLRHPPVPGKKIVARFKAEIDGVAWPTSGGDLIEYLRASFFGAQRESARRHLAQLVVKCSIDLPPSVPNRVRLSRQYARATHALNEIDPVLLEATLATVVTNKEQGAGLSEDEIRSAVGALGDLTLFWDAIPQASVPRVVSCIKDSELSDPIGASVLAMVAPVASVAGQEVQAVVAARIGALESTQLADTLARRVSRPLVEELLSRVENSPGWGTTNVLIPYVAAVGDRLSDDDIKRLCVAAVTNYEIYQAHASKPELASLSTATQDRLGLRGAWISVARYIHPYSLEPAFPEVRAAVLEQYGADALVEGDDDAGGS